MVVGIEDHSVCRVDDALRAAGLLPFRVDVALIIGVALRKPALVIAEPRTADRFPGGVFLERAAAPA